MSNPYESPKATAAVPLREPRALRLVARSIVGAVSGAAGYWVLVLALHYYTDDLTSRALREAWPYTVLFAAAGMMGVVLRSLVPRALSPSRCALLSFGVLVLCLLMTAVAADSFGFANEREMRALTSSAHWTRVATTLTTYLLGMLVLATTVWANRRL